MILSESLPSLRPRLSALSLCWVVTLAILGCSGASVETETISPEAPTDSLTAEQVLSKMLQTYRGAKTYADQATYSRRRVKKSEGVPREQVIHEMSLALEKPNKIRFKMNQMYPKSRQNVSYDVASNGEIMHSVAGILKEQIHETEAPAQLTLENFIPEPNIRKAALEVSLENIYPQLAMMLTEGNGEKVFPKDNRPRLISEEKLGDRMCHRVVMESLAGKRTLWIDAETHLLLRMELPIEGEMKSLDPQKRFSEYSIWIDYKDVWIDSEIEDERFVMEIPEGARRVSKLVLPPTGGPPPALGKPVGNYSFTTLDTEEEITPDSHPNKVVVLDFWSVTCPPCREHTPVLEEVYQKLKDEERFVFYAVNANLRKAKLSNDDVQEVFDNWGGTFPVLRDLEETSDFELGIRAYPHTVIVGPDGRLQFDEAGMHTKPEPLLEIVQKLLDGGDPAAEAIAQHQEKIDQFERDLEAATIGEVESGP